MMLSLIEFKMTPIPQPLSPAPSDGVTLASSSTLRGPQALAHCFGLQLRFGICAQVMGSQRKAGGRYCKHQYT